MTAGCSMRNDFRKGATQQVASEPTQDRRERYVDRRTCQGDQQFLLGIFGHALEAGQTADGEKRNVPRVNPESERGQRMS